MVNSSDSFAGSQSGQKLLGPRKVTLTPLASRLPDWRPGCYPGILATGAWLGQLLESLGYEVDVRSPKGTLRDYQPYPRHGNLPFIVVPEGVGFDSFAGGNYP